MQLIGITGAIGHGKTSLADAFSSFVPRYLQLESGQLVAQLADLWQEHLKDIPKSNDIEAINRWLNELVLAVKQVLNAECRPGGLRISAEQIEQSPLKFVKFKTYLEELAKNPALASTKINAGNKESYRPLLQWLGGFLVERIGGDVWYKELVRRAKNTDGIDLCTIGGVRYPTDADVIHDADGIILKISRPSVPEADLLDPTEQQRQTIATDVTIINNGSLLQLESVAKLLYKDLLGGKLRKVYKAT